MLEQTTITIDDRESAIKLRVNFIADRLLLGHPEKAIQQNILKELGAYPQGVTYSSLCSAVDDELSSRVVSRQEVMQNLRFYRKLRHIACLINTRIKATDRVHKLLGLQPPDELLQITRELQMQPVVGFLEVAGEVERMGRELKEFIEAGPANEVPKELAAV